MKLKAIRAVSSQRDLISPCLLFMVVIYIIHHHLFCNETFHDVTFYQHPTRKMDKAARELVKLVRFPDGPIHSLSIYCTMLPPCAEYL